MTILTFTTESAANTALTTINSNYSVPISLPNNYMMTSWETVKKAVSENLWFFEKPDRTINSVTISQSMNSVVGHTEVANTNSDWFPSEE